MQNLDDITLIERINEGDQEAYRIIVHRYKDRVARTVIGMLGDTDEADDVGQETFIRLYKSLDKYRGEAALGTYLTRIAINLSLNALKKRKRQQLFKHFAKSDEEDDTNKRELENLPNADNEHEVRDTQELVQMALQNIDTKFRAVLILRLIDGFSTKEAAEALNIPLGTVLSRLTRGQEKLKVELKKLGYEN